MFDTSKIGYTFPPVTIDIEGAKIRELAQAIGDDNPIYSSQQATQPAGYPDIPLSPTTGTLFLFGAMLTLSSNSVGLAWMLPGSFTWKKLTSTSPRSILTKP